MTEYHIHHIIPRHAGGTDEPDNLIRLTVEDHAKAHKELYEQYGRWQDHVAYLGLSKQITLEEASRIALSEGRKNGGKIVGKKSKDPLMQAAKIRKMWQNPEIRKRLSEKRKEQSRNGNNPMQGKQQKKACCLNCKNVISINGLKLHQRSCY
jgi:hypothetical protein